MLNRVFVSFTICHNRFPGKPVRGPLYPDYVPSVFLYATKAAVKPPSAHDLRTINRSQMGFRTSECGTTLDRTS